MVRRGVIAGLVVEPATTDQDTLQAAQARAEGLDDELALNDPTKLVLNVRVAGDVDATEADLREVWGGALCVSPAEHTLADLHSIQTGIGDDLDDSGQLQGTGVDVTRGVVEVTVFVDAGLQDGFDERYGDGVVEVLALLQPVD